MYLPSLWRSGLDCLYLLSDTFTDYKVLFSPPGKEGAMGNENVYTCTHTYLQTHTIPHWCSSQNAHGTAHMYTDTKWQQCEHRIMHSDKIFKWIHKQEEYGVLVKYSGDALTLNLLIPLEIGHLYLCQPANPIFRASFLIFRIQLYILSSPAAMPTEVNLASK